MGNFHYLDKERKPRGPVSEGELERLDAQAKAEGWQLLVATPGSASWTPFSKESTADTQAAPPTPAPSPVPVRPTAPVRPSASQQTTTFTSQSASFPAPAPFAAPSAPFAAPFGLPPFGTPMASGPRVHWIAITCYILAIIVVVMDIVWLVLGLVNMPKVAEVYFLSSLIAAFLLGLGFAVFLAWAGHVAGLLARIATGQRN